MTPMSQGLTWLSRPRDARPTCSLRIMVMARVLLPCVLAALVLSHGSGCLFAPPIEPEPFEVNLAPMIDDDFIAPPFDRTRVVISEPTFQIDVNAVFDPNPDEELHFVWVSATGAAVLGSGVLGRVDPGQLLPDYQDAYYVYERLTLERNRCDFFFGNLDSDTLTLYVSDEPFLSILPPDGQQPVVIQEDAYLAQRSWTLIFEAPCDG